MTHKGDPATLIALATEAYASKISSFKPSAPQNVAPPKPVIVPWQKKK